MLTVTDIVRATRYLAAIFNSFVEKLELKYDTQTKSIALGSNKVVHFVHFNCRIVAW